MRHGEGETSSAGAAACRCRVLAGAGSRGCHLRYTVVVSTLRLYVTALEPFHLTVVHEFYTPLDGHRDRYLYL